MLQKTNLSRKELSMNKNPITYKNKKVYIGMDVHKKSYTLSAYCQGRIVKSATTPADPEKVTQSLKKWFPSARLYSVYEAGFSGYSLHRTLCCEGIKNIVVNPASIEIAVKDRVKTDCRDSRKLGEQLSMDRLKGIYIPGEKEELRRQITRTRRQVVIQMQRVSNQIKGKLFYFGVISGEDNRRLSERYVQELEGKNFPEELKFSLGVLIKQWRMLKEQLKEIETEMMEQSFEDGEVEEVYRSVPGVGAVVARVLSNELGDLSKRFSNNKSLYKYMGLTPSEYSSGEKSRKGSIDRQGSGYIRSLLVQAAWRVIIEDKALRESFERIALTRGKKRAIVAIARKLIGRIRACFCKKTLYEINWVEKK